MGFYPFEVNVPHLAYTLLGGFVVIFGMMSLFIKEKLYIGEAPIAVAVGIIIGPHCAGLFTPTKWAGEQEETIDEITLEFTRVVIAIAVFAVGVELPKAYMKRHWRTLFFLLGPCMLWGWMISGLLIWALIPHLNFLSSLVIAATVTPTDPILAQAVIGGKFADKHVPAHIRHMLSAESGSNDGAAFPFLFIAIYLTLDASDGHAIGEWFYYTIAYEVILGVIIGSILGFVARKVMKFAERKRLIDRQSYVAQYVSLAVLSIGMTSLLGSDDLLSAFACGCAFAWDGFFNKATEDAVFSNVIDLLFNCAAFIYIGAIIPFEHFNYPEWDLQVWRLVVLTLLILLLRRIPIILATYKFIPDIKTFREALFTGWFGPMGVGAIFIATLARQSLPEGDPDADTHQVDAIRALMLPIVTFLVLSSVLTHGLSIPFFSLGRRVHSITYTWSRNPSMDTRRDDEPAWTTHARRITAGQDIVINRDDDAEEGDLGIRRRDTDLERIQSEKLGENGEDGSGGSSSSRTRAGEETYEMTESPRRMDSGEKERRDSDDAERRDSGEEPDAESGDRALDDDEAARSGQQTPPLAEYREGNHLIRERKRGDGEEVEVEVIRNHFADHKEAERHSFVHPHRLKHKEVDKITQNLPKSLEHAVSHVEDEGKHAIDRLGLGLMHSHTSTEASPSDRSRSPSPERSKSPRRRSAGEDEAGPSRHQASGSVDSTTARPPAIKIDSGTHKPSLRERIFGHRKSSSESAPRQTEEGFGGDPSLLSPPPTRTVSRSVPITSPNPPSDDGGKYFPRTTSIRFAPDSSPSSSTAPGPGNYGNQQPGFKKNPALAMYRSQSVQSQTGSTKSGNGGGAEERTPSVSFKEPPEKKR